jgi:hypothetical protein
MLEGEPVVGVPAGVGGGPGVSIVKLVVTKVNSLLF